VEETVLAQRFHGNILTQDQITTSTVLKPNNTYDFSVDSPSFTILQNPGQTPTATISFDSISELRSSAPQGLILDEGGTYTLTVSSNTAQYYVFFVQLTIRTGYNWEGARTNLAPASGTPSTGSFSLYPAGNNQYVWNIPEGTSSASLTLTASEDHPINITDIVVKTYKAVLY
jgi:hypothetical protein